jgi:hypothetical protein
MVGLLLRWGVLQTHACLVGGALVCCRLLPVYSRLSYGVLQGPLSCLLSCRQLRTGRGWVLATWVT